MLQLLEADAMSKMKELVESSRVRPALKDDSGAISIFQRKCGILLILMPPTLLKDSLQDWS